MEYLLVKNNESTVLEYNNRKGERKFELLCYSSEFEYPLATIIIDDNIVYDKPIVFYNDVSHEDYLFICDCFKVLPEKGFDDLRVWANIQLINNKTNNVDRILNQLADITKQKVQTPYTNLLKKKLSDNGEKLIEISVRVNYKSEHKIKIIIKNDNKFYEDCTSEQISTSIEKLLEANKTSEEIVWH